MYYYKLVGNTIEKYLVEFDEVRLLELRDEIINWCSIKSHKEYKATTLCDESSHIRNFKQKIIGVKEYNGVCDTFSDVPMYEFSYDYLAYPSIVCIIDRILLNDENAFAKLLLDEPLEEDSPSKKYNDMIKELVDGKDISIDHENYFKKLNEIYCECLSNIDRVSPLMYYDKVRSCFNLIYDSSFNLEDMRHLFYFSNTICEKDFFNESLTRILKKK